jgi:Ca2+-binding RTX toxin-like protein
MHGRINAARLALNTRTRLLLAGVVGAAALAAGPAAAHAANVQVIGSPTQNIQYTAADGEVNDVGVLRDSTTNRFVFREFGTAPLTAGIGCTQLDPQRASCPRSGIVQVLMTVKDQNDRVRLGASHGLGELGSACCIVGGGDGADNLDATFVTTQGVALNGEVGNDTLHGGAGPDLLRGGAGFDTYAGGDGVDEVSYSDHTTAVAASLDGVANDGSPGVDSFFFDGRPSENIPADVEALSGGKDNDTLTGNADPNRLFGLLGSDDVRGLQGADTLDGGSNGGVGSGDVLNGGAGPDVLFSAPGPDRMIGGGGFDTVTYENQFAPVTADLDNIADDGADGGAEGDNAGGDDIEELVGGSGDDTLKGNGQANSIVGGLGSDVLKGFAGDDSLFANDAIHDTVVCGGDTDLASVDLQDGPAGFSDCETVDQAAVDQHPTVKIRSRELRLRHHHGAGDRHFVRVKLHCPRRLARGCKGSLTIAKHGGVHRLGHSKRGAQRVVGRARYHRIAAGSSRRVRVPVRRRATRAVHRHGQIEVTIRARELDNNGEPKITLRRVKLHR